MSKKMHKLQYLRKRKGLSQQDVSSLLGITVYAYQKIEQGARGLSLEYARKLVNIVGVKHIDDLLDEAI